MSCPVIPGSEYILGARVRVCRSTWGEQLGARSEQDHWLVIPSRIIDSSSLCRAEGDLGQLVAQSRTGAPQV
ncbi:hypothetical protein A2U01_0094575, partial [Trifolium medium]|nr:hypothetical protein [Trifolium medium]